MGPKSAYKSQTKALAKQGIHHTFLLINHEDMWQIYKIHLDFLNNASGLS